LHPSYVAPTVTTFGEAGDGGAKVGAVLIASIALGVGVGWGIAAIGLRVLTHALKPSH
jgi:hypothetical protein